jgi:hypothetical protein
MYEQHAAGLASSRIGRIQRKSDGGGDRGLRLLDPQRCEAPSHHDLPRCAHAGITVAGALALSQRAGQIEQGLLKVQLSRSSPKFIQ